MKVSLKTNLLIDLLLFVSMALMSIAGIVLRVVRPLARHAQEEWVREAAAWVMSCGRGVWFKIHLWAGIVMMLLLAVHIILHWNTITAYMSKHIASKGARVAITLVLLLLLVVSVVPWVFAI